jgi:DNA (cytosine-5)-methyltransferase 1
MSRDAELRLITPAKNGAADSKADDAWFPLTTIDLFCGAGGITEGFRQAGYHCLYGNDCMREAVETFSFNHFEAWGDPRDIEKVDPTQVRKRPSSAPWPCCPQCEQGKPAR